MAGPVDWVLKLVLFVNIFREHFPLLTWPDDPLDLTEWFTGLDTWNWNVVVAPNGFLKSMASGIVWGIVAPRMTNWHDMSHTMLEDAELLVTCTRYLAGDPPPWKGARLRHGQLVVDIVDKSGVFVGTSNGGSIFDGLIRTIVEFADDFIDSTVELIVDSSTTVPQDYFRFGHKYTDKRMPYVVYLEGENSPIQTSQFITSPTKCVQVITGGHSFPGVNEVISASIQAGFDILGSLIFMGGLGGVIDTLVKPLYEDVILAWWVVKSPIRAQHSGWSRYFEYMVDAPGKAYTIASLFVLRAGFWATKNVVSWKVQVNDGLPYMIGDRGLGHFFLEDRVGLVLKGDETNAIHMDRCRKLDLGWDENAPVEWQINIGDDRIWQDPAQRAWGKIEAIVAALRDLGVW